MCCVKFNGFLQEILENPTVDLVEFLQDRLFLSLDKAEVLACRIQKDCLQAIVEDTERKHVRLIAEKPVDLAKCKAAVYNFGCLSNKEFEVFMTWFLQGLGYSVISEKAFERFGVDFISVKDGLKTAILARKYCGDCVVSDVAVLLAEQAKISYQCEHVIVLVTAFFSEQARLAAEKCGVELWDVQNVCEKAVDFRKKADLSVQVSLPKYERSLFDSLMSLADCKVFIIERRVGEKFDLFFPGVNFPLLTFHVQKELVTRLVFRVKYNESVGEHAGEVLFGYDKSGNRFGPEDVGAYTRVIEYLEQFLE
ncbi:MAG: restriction endonuclease [Nitrososphaerota archaeon]|jgi:hypothetical protein|nr:restriction endonuclease [Nitrososphaerota archaeon]